MAESERTLLLGERIVFGLRRGNFACHYWIEPRWKDRRDSQGGVEIHRTPAEGETPDNDDCWILKGPCCHDGSSLYASETVNPLFFHCCDMFDGNYEPIWDLLEERITYEEKYMAAAAS